MIDVIVFRNGIGIFAVSNATRRLLWWFADWTSALDTIAILTLNPSITWEPEIYLPR